MLRLLIITSSQKAMTVSHNIGTTSVDLHIMQSERPMSRNGLLQWVIDTNIIKMKALTSIFALLDVLSQPRSECRRKHPEWLHLAITCGNPMLVWPCVLSYFQVYKVHFSLAETSKVLTYLYKQLLLWDQPWNRKKVSCPSVWNIYMNTNLCDSYFLWFKGWSDKICSQYYSILWTNFTHNGPIRGFR